MERKPEFRFRLNGVIMPELRVWRKQINGEYVGRLEVALRDQEIGWIVLDDNSQLCDRSLSRFILEYRNETQWRNATPIQRLSDTRKGWRVVSVRKLLKVLKAAGLIGVSE